MNTGDGGILSVTHAKNNFILGIILQAVTSEALIDIRVDPLEWLQDGNRQEGLRSEGTPVRRPPAEKEGRTPQANQVVDGTGDAPGNRNER
jgi:hypothetical protein